MILISYSIVHIYEDITIFGEGEWDTIPFAILVATRFAVYSGKLHQPTKITRNDIINDIIITDDVIGHVTHINKQSRDIIKRGILMFHQRIRW